MAITFSGMSSGIDTSSIITALVSVERNHQTLLKIQQSGYQSTLNALSSLKTGLTNLQSAANTLADTSGWTGTKATSSSTNVTATASGSTASSLTFNVTKVAQAHSLISADSVASKSDVVASSGSVTITGSTGSATAIDVGTGSLNEVINAINSSSTGVTASAMQTSSGVYRLKLQSNSTGAASQFSVSGLDGFTAMNTLSAGQDAKVWVGDLATGFEASSTSNTFSNLVDGLSFTVSKEENNVTVSSSVDATDVSTKAQALVNSANSLLTFISNQTKWDATSKTGGPLMGSSSVRSLQESILGLVGGAGISGLDVSADGQLTFDSAAFTTAFTADPAGLSKKLGGSMTSNVDSRASSTSLTLSSYTQTTKPGTYDVNVSQAATREQWTATTAGSAAGSTFGITSGSSTLSYTAGGAETLAGTVAGLNAKFTTSNVGIAATLSGNNIVFTASSYGTAHNFSLTMNSLQQTLTTAGRDVTGTIDGQATTGTGQVLSLASGTGGAVGLSVNVASTAGDITATSGALGSVTFASGLAKQFSQLVSDVTDSTSGSISSDTSAAQDMVTEYQSQIDTWDTRLTNYQAQLSTQFTAMETMLNTLKNQSSALTSMLGTLTTSTSSSTGTLPTG